MNSGDVMEAREEAGQSGNQAVIRSVLAAYGLSRLFIALFVYLGHLSHPFQEKMEGGFVGVSNWLLNAWTVYDSQHFLSLARQGYSPETAPFFPLYPWLLRALGEDENRMALVGVVISNGAFLGALLLFFGLTRDIYGPKIARWALWLLAFFPAAAYSMAVYTESLFLLFALGAFWSARRQKWLVAALLAFLAALTRNSGPILALALLAEWWRQRKAGDSPSALAWGAMLMPCLAFIAVQGFIRSQLGDVSSLSAQATYGRALTWPWLPLWRDLLEMLSGRHLEVVTLLNFGSTIMALLLLWRHRATMPPSDAVFLGSVMLIQLCLARVWAPFTIASLRYLFSTWPFTQLVALEIEALATNRLRVMALSFIYLLLCAVHSYLFGLKSFLG